MWLVKSLSVSALVTLDLKGIPFITSVFHGLCTHPTHIFDRWLTLYWTLTHIRWLFYFANPHRLYGIKSSRSFLSHTRRHGTSGWRTVVIGASPASCGGGTESQLTLLQWMTPLFLLEMLVNKDCMCAYKFLWIVCVLIKANSLVYILYNVTVFICMW